MTTPTGPLRGPLRKKESRLWSRQGEDWYREPLWCSARLFDNERFEGTIYDPSCGSGRILQSAASRGHDVLGSDIVKRSEWCGQIVDFCCDEALIWPQDNIVANPPFALCNGVPPPYADRALTVAEKKVALLLPAGWMNGLKRSHWLETTPLRRVWLLTPRPSMPPGDLPEDANPGNGTTDYAWFVWEHGYAGKPEIGWLRRDDPPGLAGDIFG